MNEQHHIDTDIDLHEIANVTDLPEDEQVDVGPHLSPSDIREAAALGEIKPSIWLYSNGHETELRACPKSLRRVAKARVRELVRDQEDVTDD